MHACTRIPHLPFRCHCLAQPSRLRSPDPIHPLLPTLHPTCTYEDSRTLAQAVSVAPSIRLSLSLSLSLSLVSLPVSASCLRSLHSFISKCTHRCMYDPYRNVQPCIRALHPHPQANMKATLTTGTGTRQPPRRPAPHSAPLHPDCPPPPPHLLSHSRLLTFACHSDA